MRRAIVNIGCIVSGDWRKPIIDGDAILMEGEKILKVGSVLDAELQDCDLVIDANGVTAGPGLIDSHVHIAFGDYSPRLTAVNFLQNYLHGGTTTAISASEIHVPGYPHTVQSAKALALAAKECWDHYRPGGMRVFGGNVILEPGMTDADFKELADKGIWLAKAGFGNVKTPFDYVPLIASAKKAGMITNVHTGGASLNLANSILGEHLVAMQPDVSFHVNGGPIAMPDQDFELVIDQTKAALQIVQAGNIRTALLTLDLVLKKDCYDRFLIGTDTPTSTGVMPQGMIKTIAEMSCLSGVAPELLIAAATGNNARTYRLNSGFIAAGKDADILLFDAALACSKTTALEALQNGDVTSAVGCFTAGVPRYIGRSRCTPPPGRYPKIVKNQIVSDFAVPPMLI